MVVTERDRQILHLVYDFRVITREQVERLQFQPDGGQDHFTKTSRLLLRLKLLFQNGYLEREPMPVRAGSWAWRPVYRLARKGAELVATDLGLTAQELPYWGRSDVRGRHKTELSPLFLDHVLAINDIRIAVILAANERGYLVEKWVDDTHLKSETMRDYVTIDVRAGRRARVPVIPDAYFIVNLGNRRAHFFLELDRATMTNSRWKARALAYQEYVKSGKYHQRYQTTSLRILTVAPTQRRLANLKRTTEEAGGGDRFWFTTLDRAASNAVLFLPIWKLAGDQADAPEQALLI